MGASLNVVSEYQNALAQHILLGKSETNTGASSPDPRFPAAEVAAYRGNIQATAVAALDVSFPSLRFFLGDEMFEQLVLATLQQFPPHVGDWGQWGKRLINVLVRTEVARRFPFVVGVARLDWRVHLTARAADNQLDQQSLQLLQSVDLDRIGVSLAQHVSLISSRYTLIALRRGESLQAEAAATHYRILVSRPGYEVSLDYLSEAEYQFYLGLQNGLGIGSLLEDPCCEGVDFPQWAATAVQRNLINHFYIIEQE